MSEIELPFIDFTSKFALVKSQETRRKFIFDTLCDIAKIAVKPEKKKQEKIGGLLIVYGKFDRNENKVYGLTQLPNKKNINDEIIWLQDKNFKEFLIENSESNDGAIIINHDGLVLGTKIYVCVTNPLIQIEDDCATRHLSAMSFSEREDVIATYTLSEETSKVRMYVAGKRAELFDPYSPNKCEVI